MPIRLRFALHGTRNNRIFHLVAIDARHARNAAPAELLGIYDPRLPATIHPDATRRTPNTYNVKENPARTVRWSVDRIRYWLSVGAVPSKSVARLLEAGGILGKEGKRIVPEGVSIHALNTKCSRCGVDGHAVRDCDQLPEKVVKQLATKQEEAVEEEVKEERKEPQNAFADLLKASREFAASSTTPTTTTTPLPVIQDLTTPSEPRQSLLADMDIVPPSRSPLAGYTIDSLSSMSEDEITMLFTFWEEWEEARLDRIRARREFENEQEDLDDDLREALQQEWDDMGPEPDIYGYNQLEDESDMYAGEGEGERYPLYEKKDIEREFEKIRDQTTPAHKFVPSKLSREESGRREKEWKAQREAEFVAEKISALKAQPDLVEPSDLEALFRDVKKDVDLEKEREAVLEHVAKGKSLKR